MKNIVEVRQNSAVHWVGDGFPVRNMFSYQEGAAFDPFLLLDYAGPHTFPPSTETRGVGEHPHRGFETVTVVYEGELEHRDSSGSHGSIAAGDVQWMTAASGVVHEEFHSERFAREGGTLEMVQLWVNLRAKDKMSQPRYQAITKEQIPVVELPKMAGTARVIAGELHGVQGPAKTFSPINVWDLQLRPDAATDLRVPDGHTCVLILQTGTLRANGQSVQGVGLVLFERAGELIRLEASGSARALVLTGEPLNEPIVGRGPFVMNTQEEVQRAFQEYRAGGMGHLS